MNIEVRLDLLLVRCDAPIDLFADIPVEADAVEEMMNRKKAFA